MSYLKNVGNFVALFAEVRLGPSAAVRPHPLEHYYSHICRRFAREVAIRRYRDTLQK